MASSSLLGRFRSIPVQWRQLYLHHRPLSTTSLKSCQKIDGGVDHDDDTIYQGILSTQIKLVKGFSLTTSAIGISCQPLLFMQMNASGANLALMGGIGAFLSLFTFATPLLIHYVSKKYVTEIKFNKLEDTYTAITYSFFLRKKEVSIFSAFF